MSPLIAGTMAGMVMMTPVLVVMVVGEVFGFCTRVTPVVLWLRSIATVLPVVVSVEMAGVMPAVMALVLVTLAR